MDICIESIDADGVEFVSVVLEWRMWVMSPEDTGANDGHVERTTSTGHTPQDSRNRGESWAQIGRASPGELHPAALQQHDLWRFDRRKGGTLEYIVPLALHLSGPLSDLSIHTALEQVSARHEVLRTRFEELNDDLFQIVTESTEIQLAVVDLSRSPANERMLRAKHFISTESQRAFDLEHDVPYRLYLLRLGPNDHVLFIQVHHIIWDGWSDAIFLEEFAGFYNASVMGDHITTEPLSIQYGDYAAWQRRRFEMGDLAGQVDFWRQQLSNQVPLALPTDYPRSPALNLDIAGDHVTNTISHDLISGLRDLSRRQGATLFITLLTAFKALLVRYTGQSDILIGTFAAGRTHPSLEKLIGLFATMLPMRTELGPHLTFVEALRRVRATALAAYANQDLPFTTLVRETDAGQRPGPPLSIQVIFTLQNFPWTRPILTLLNTTELPVERDLINCDLAFQLRERSDGSLQSVAEYRRVLFEADRIADMLHDFHVVLETVVNDPEQPISRMPLRSF